MNLNVPRHVIAMIGTGMLLTGCSQGQAAFRTVQVCLDGPQDIPEFVSAMDSIAQDYQMEFSNRGAAAEAELRAISNKNVPIPHPLVAIAAEHSGDFGFGAGNLGLTTRQVAIGFDGNDTEAARKFADAAVARLSKRWRIYEVAKGRGAAPLPNCN